jgi:hypothetical protein
VQAVGHDVLAGARLALDQHRVGQACILFDLRAQAFHLCADADQGGQRWRRVLMAGPGELAQQCVERLRLRRFGDEFGGAECARVAGDDFLALAGQHDDARVRRMRQQVGDQCVAFVGAVRVGRQAEIDQRQRRRLRLITQPLDGRTARRMADHVEIRFKQEGQRVGDQRIVVDDQQSRAARGTCRSGSG